MYFWCIFLKRRKRAQLRMLLFLYHLLINILETSSKIDENINLSHPFWTTMYHFYFPLCCYLRNNWVLFDKKDRRLGDTIMFEYLLYADLCSNLKADSHGPTVLTDTHATHSEIKSFSPSYPANTPIEGNVTYYLRQLYFLLLSYHVNGNLQIL